MAVLCRDCSHDPIDGEDGILQVALEHRLVGVDHADGWGNLFSVDVREPLVEGEDKTVGVGRKVKQDTLLGPLFELFLGTEDIVANRTQDRDAGARNVFVRE